MGGNPDERIRLAKAGHAKVDQEFSPPVAGFGIYPDLIQGNLFNYSSVAIRADLRLGFQSLGGFAKGEVDH